jgi:hypothetical protein
MTIASKTALVLLLAFAPQYVSGASNAAELNVSAQNPALCSGLIENITLNEILLRTNQAVGFLKPKQNICETLSKFKGVNQVDLVITSTPSGDLYKICIGSSMSSPCSDIIADVEPGISAGDALQFAYVVNLQKDGPQKQTVERLFIRPSTLIK